MVRWSPDGDSGAFSDQRVKSGGIPVRKADAAMASGTDNGIGNRAVVDGYAAAVQSGREDADGVVGAGGKVVEVIGALPAFEGAVLGSVPSHTDELTPTHWTAHHNLDGRKA